jgi:hypothetical protein
MKMKRCYLCKESKSLDEFYKDLRRKDGKQGRCKKCSLAHIKEWAASNPVQRRDTQKAWRTANIDEIKYKASHRSEEAKAKYRIARAKWNKDNTSKTKEYDKKRNVDNKEKRQATSLKWRAKNPNWETQYYATIKNDPQYKLRKLLRQRIRSAIHNSRRNGSAVIDLGADIPTVVGHIESLFKLGMTWGNWGNHKGHWHLDHIVPLSAFDLANRQHFVLACHYCNLQPLWAEENMRKRNSLDFAMSLIK